MGVALSINLGLHLGTRTQPDPNSLKLKTFHSALILHTLLSLRLSRAPLIVLEDYNVAIPPVDGNEDFELWRSDKTPVELREDWSSAKGKSALSIDSPALTPGTAPTRPPQAVRSASLSTFARMASLCAIGLSILRWDVCPRRGYGNGLASGEQERMELVENLKGWTDGLEKELLLGEKGGGVERLEERARWTVEMHLISSALNLKLKPHTSVELSKVRNADPNTDLRSLVAADLSPRPLTIQYLPHSSCSIISSIAIEDCLRCIDLYPSSISLFTPFQQRSFSKMTTLLISTTRLSKPTKSSVDSSPSRKQALKR